jgi:hypothetical protein
MVDILNLHCSNIYRRIFMLVSINGGNLINYDGPGCYNFNTGARVGEGHLHNDRIDYIDLNRLTYTIDIPHDGQCFWMGFGLGLLICASALLICMMAGIV